MDALVGAMTPAEILQAVEASSQVLDESLHRKIDEVMSNAVGVVPIVSR